MNPDKLNISVVGVSEEVIQQVKEMISKLYLYTGEEVRFGRYSIANGFTENYQQYESYCDIMKGSYDEIVFKYGQVAREYSMPVENGVIVSGSKDLGYVKLEDIVNIINYTDTNADFCIQSKVDASAQEIFEEIKSFIGSHIGNTIEYYAKSKSMNKLSQRLKHPFTKDESEDDEDSEDSECYDERDALLDNSEIKQPIVHKTEKPLDTEPVEIVPTKTEDGTYVFEYPAGCIPGTERYVVEIPGRGRCVFRL